ncbi:tetratricopeptide repeat protein [Rhodocyclus tenuis]|uniref:tetratricopeptide repeat protein n=1 Tax=Rhodocyclus tenuis TaxID=1066 RepID=UPI001903A8ED|nr:tetratricopeptide repeat protein [Rhodocyclus tenuis]MBK1678916.1 hypothetical protein [Rhodocyclus tenuis]
MRKLLCLLLVCATGTAFAGVKEDEDAAARRDMQKVFERVKAAQAEKARRENLLPYPDPIFGEASLRQGQEWVSDWKQREKRDFSALLANSEADVLLVPFQVQASGIERANRSLMTASLAQALSASAKLVDPYLVAGALGDGERRLDRQDVLQLASQLRVKRIVWAYAGHRPEQGNPAADKRLRLYFQIQERGPAGGFSEGEPPAGKAIETLEFSDLDPPVAVFRKNLPAIVGALGYQYKAPATTKVDALSKALPATLAAAVQPVSLSNAAQQLQLLASLLPGDAARLRERLYERSLLIAWQLPVGDAATRLLAARALHGLRMRPAALAVIGQPANEEERALLAAINGNLPELDASVAKLPFSPQKVMAAIDATDIRYAYESDTPKSAAAREALVDALPAVWQGFLARRFADADPTRLRRFGNFELLEALGKEFPSAGPGIQQKIRGRQIAGQSESADVDLAIGAYLNPAVAGKSSAACCSAAGWQPERRDLLDFLVQSAVANVLYNSYRMSVVQGLYPQTLQYLNAIDGVFGTQPEIMAARALAEENLAARAEAPGRDRLLNTARLDAERARYWQTGTEHAWADRPNHLATPYYKRNGQAMPGHLENALSALANASYQTNTLTASFYLTPPADREKLLAETAGRFAGDNTRALLQADLLQAQGRGEEARVLLQQVLKERPLQLAVYKRLGTILLEEGRYAEAAKAYAQYPGLQGDAGNPLLVDNYAHQVGSLFFWRGETDLAKDFYKVSAALATGSESSLTSAARNATIDGDYAQALAAQFNAARRYGDSYRYRDYFSLLHMLGESDAAWDGFQSMVGRFTTPHLWDSALVGHRRQGRDEKWLIDWARQAGQGAGGRAQPLATRFLSMAMVTDRIPDRNAVRAVEAMSGNPAGHSLQGRFVEAYGAFKRQDFAGAWQSLAEAGKADRLSDADNSYVLPTFALAAVKVGKVKELQALLASISQERRNMDYWLAQSVLAAAAGNADALKDFRQALNTRVFTEFRPIGVEYQFADVAQSVFELTGDRQFKALALQLARFNQKIQPWEAWSYAIEARLTDNAGERKAALVKAVYLDRKSERLSRLPPSELEEALKAAGKTPPFKSVPENLARGI